MEVNAIIQKVHTEARLNRAFERLIEIKLQKTLLEEEERLINAHSRE